ncbi:MAG: heparinase II/III family protein [Candidatus Pacebacteria bacterium]|nr:heparinase II/III family protein [Candidatus Paceibacterota bacterium]
MRTRRHWRHATARIMAGVFCTAFTACMMDGASGAALAKRDRDKMVVPIDLMDHAAEDKATIKRIGPAEYEWHLPDGVAQSLHIDLTKLGIEPSEFDEFRFELMPEGSLVMVQAIVKGLPSDDEVSSWYSKFDIEIGEWNEGRYDLRVDDDGIYFSGRFPEDPAGLLTLRLSRRVLGVPGEPAWRKARLRNPRFVRYPVAVEFRLDECQMETGGAEVSYTYTVHLKNRTAASQTVLVEPDSKGTLKYFSVTTEKEVQLPPNASLAVEIRVSIPRSQALRLPALYAEPLVPKISVKGMPDSDVIPIMGYRSWPLWGVVPIFNRKIWTPATFQAFLDARALAMPKIADWRKSVAAHAENACKHDWPMPENMLPAHDAGYRCTDPECRGRLRPASAMSLHKHVCSKCGKVYENNEGIDRAGLALYYGKRASATRACALAWLLTGEDKYAEKASSLLLSLAAAYPDMPVNNARSTAGASKLGVSTLLASYILPRLAEGYAFLSSYSDLSADQRSDIESTLTDEALRIARHCVEYSNMTAEHLRAYGSTAIATGFWPLAGEAVYGEFGWHELVERGYSEGGIAHEAGAYHRAIFHAMDEFAAFALEQNVNLYTERFKRVYDGSLSVGNLAAASYEAAYTVYRDPAYLRILQGRRGKGTSGQAIFHGTLGLADVGDIPITSTHMPGAGYIFLRRGQAGDSYEIRLNYIKYFDRDEKDRFSTFFLRNGRQLETMPGRMSYGDYNAEFMYATAAHNTVVIDGQDQRAVHGRLVAYEPDPDTPLAVVATASDTPLYEGVQQLRAIALIENNYIVFDAVRCDKPRTVDRYQYGRGQAAFSSQLTPADSDFPHVPHPDFNPITKVAVGAPGKQGVLKFKDNFTMTVVSEQDMQLCRALTHGGYGGRPMEVTFARVANTRDASFLAAFTWGDKPAPPALTIIENTPDEIRLGVDIGPRTYAIDIDVAGKTAKVVKH